VMTRTYLIIPRGLAWRCGAAAYRRGAWTYARSRLAPEAASIFISYSRSRRLRENVRMKELSILALALSRLVGDCSLVRVFPLVTTDNIGGGTRMCSIAVPLC
jgi:hypothetical protein